MAELKSGLVLNDGEELVAEIEAELWATSSNPIAKTLGKIQKTVAGLLGTKRKGFVVITNKRVIEVASTIQCWKFEISREVKYLLPSSIKEVGYTKEAVCGMFCPAYHLYYEGFTQTTSVLLDAKKDEEAQRIVDSFYAALTK
ncbi:MAG: hypothetical protein J5817_05365 [Treponema sp.]|nr:hypothetical protein [Treponema sp.]